MHSMPCKRQGKTRKKKERRKKEGRVGHKDAMIKGRGGEGQDENNYVGI